MLAEELELDREEIASERTEDFLLACGLEHHEVAEVIRSACSAAGRAGTVVLELSQGDGPPEVTAATRAPRLSERTPSEYGGFAMNSGPVLAPDAAIILGIASTAMPFARTPEDEVERWLRVLRLHGQVGIALQALGVSESTLPAARDAPAGEPLATRAGGDPDAVAHVTEQAVAIAADRGAKALDTTDVLMAVMRVYGAAFDARAAGARHRPRRGAGPARADGAHGGRGSRGQRSRSRVDPLTLARRPDRTSVHICAAHRTRRPSRAFL